MKSELLNKLYEAGMPPEEALAIVSSPVRGECTPYMSNEDPYKQLQRDIEEQERQNKEEKKRETTEANTN